MHENVTVQQSVSAPVDKVWNALTDKAQMKEWYFDISDFELGIHNEFNFFEPGDEKKYHHHGEILELIPNEKLKHTWSYPEFSKEKNHRKMGIRKRWRRNRCHRNPQRFGEFCSSWKRFSKRKFRARLERNSRKKFKRIC